MNTNPKLEDYVKKTYNSDSELLFFLKSDFLGIRRRFNALRYIIKILFPIYFKPFYKEFRRKYEIISTNIHSKKWYNVVEGKVILDSTKIEDIELYIKKNHKSIINEVVKKAKEDKGVFSKLWMLPAKFVTIQIYNDNVRERESRISKTKGVQVCSLRLNSTKSIRIPIAFPNSTDVMGYYTILWSDYLNELEM